MPLYEFYCPPCGVQFEVLRPMSESRQPAVCPAGHQTENRVVSMFATLTKAADGSTQVLDGGCACGGACSCGGGH